MNIKNIIFDLGGVLFNLDYHRTTQAFIELGLKNFDAIYSKQKQNHVFDDFEKGLTSTAAFRIEVKQHFPDTVTDSQIDSAWNAMLIGIPVDRYKWLELISEQYNIYLLSNTNEIHIAEVEKMINQHYGFKKFVNIFKKTYFSCELKMRKPDAEIFELVITENQLNKSETLFIDDSIQHVEGAKSVGLNIYHLKDGELIENIISKKLI
jgi:glucose-1-phosphatase